MTDAASPRTFHLTLVTGVHEDRRREVVDHLIASCSADGSRAVQYAVGGSSVDGSSRVWPRRRRRPIARAAHGMLTSMQGMRLPTRRWCCRPDSRA